jgi:hypothetical protein
MYLLLLDPNMLSLTLQVAVGPWKCWWSISSAIAANTFRIFDVSIGIYFLGQEQAISGMSKQVLK